MKQNKVATNLQQDFTDTEKAQARINIGAAASAALDYEILRADSAEKAAKSEVLAGSGISVTNTLAQDGHTIYTVANAGDSLYKRIQTSIDQPYADYAFIRNLRQTPNGEVSIECSYISAATETVDGLMSSADKTKLDGIQTGAQVNQYAWSNLQVGDTLIQADSATDTLTISAGSNITLTPDASNDSLTISSTDTNTHRPIQVNGTQNLGDNVTPLNLKAGSNVTLTANGGDVTIAAGGTDVVTRTNGQGGYVEHPVSKLTLDTDFQQILTDGTEIGVYAPTPVVAVTDKVLTVTAGSDVPLWLDTPSNAEFIQFTYGNTTTAQDDVYTAVENAYTAGKLPVLYCGVANATLYWVPTANGANGYSFSRTVSNYSYVVTIDATSHVITHQSKEIINYTAGSNVQIDANNQISATDTTYSAGYGIDINASNVISNTMHLDTAGLMISYNTLSNAGTTTHSWGPWRLQITKKAMVTWDDGTGSNPSVLVQVAHSDYISGTITNGRVQHTNYYPWKDGTMDSVYTGHVQWAFDGSYTQGGSNNGFPIDLSSPLDPDGNARACPHSMRGIKLVYNCGIDSPDWLELNIEPLYVNNNTSLSTNAARLLIRAKYFYV